jgi:hypothetical protein
MNKKQIVEDYIKFPLYILLHPIDGYRRFKEEKKAKMSVALVFLLFASILSVVQFQSTGFIVNFNNPQSMNSLRLIIYTVVPIALLSVANWSVTTLLDGKGKMKEIFMMLCYSLFPFIILGFVNVVFSNIITMEEAGFYGILAGVGTVLLGYMVFMGLLVLHEYGLFKTILTVLATGVAAAIILFLALLIFDLSQQIYGFFYSLYREVVTRFL